MGNVVRKGGFNPGTPFGVDEVRFCNGENTVLDEQLGIVLPELSKQDFIAAGNILFFGRDHEKEDRIALYVAQEAKSDAFSLAGPFDNSRNVRHYKTSVVVVTDNSKIWLKGRESVVCNLRLRGGDCGEKGGFSGVGEAHEPDIGQQFQFEDKPALDPVFARLGIAGSLVRRGLEVVVSKAATAAAAENQLLSGFYELIYDLLGFSVFHGRTYGDVEIDVFTVFTLPKGKTAGSAVFCTNHLAVFEMDERPELWIGAKDNMPSAASVSSVRTAFGDIFRAVEMGRTSPAVAAGAEYAHVVYEVGFCHFRCKDNEILFFGEKSVTLRSDNTINSKMKKILLKTAFAALAATFLISSCTPKEEVFGKRVDALDASAWDVSSWISVVDCPVVEGIIRDGDRAADGASWFVTTVKGEKKVTSAVWMTTGLGVYQLFVNGKPIGEEVLKPGFTHREKTKISYTYDITEPFLQGKDNVLAVQVTPGWWGDKIVTPGGHDGMIGKKVAFRGVLELTYADGTKELFGTDTENWKAGIAGPVKHAAIFDGEEYDARELPGWETPEKLSAPEINNEFSGEIVPTDGAEIYLRKDLALKPVQCYAWKGVEGDNEENYGKVSIVREFAPGKTIKVHPGETLVIDFGQNCSGVPSFVFSAREGTRLTFLPGELLNDGNGAKSRGMDGPEGSVHRLNLRVPKTCFILDYTFAGKKKECYTPLCTFFGYRFASITATDDVTIEKIVTIPVSSISKELEIGTIETGNELVNKLISNTLWGERSNYLSVTTDCPQRNERLGWTADTQVFTETGSFFANTDRFFHKWLRDMRDSQSPLGGYPGVAPTAQYGEDMMRLGWADAGIIVPWTVWKQFGDESIIEESWESMEKFMKHVAETKYDHNLLAAENHNYQWADWLSYEPLESHSSSAFDRDEKGRRFPRPEAISYWNYLCACYWLMDSEMMRDMANATCRDAEKYETMAQDARKHLESFFTEDGQFRTEILNTMQTPALFALKNSLVEGEAKEAMIERLRENFKHHDNCLQTGFLGTSILMDVLTENGMSDIAWELLFQRKNPSWLYSVDNGATTIWERWNSYMIEKGMGPKGMNSFNHYAYGCVCAWIWKTAAGIASDPAEPGFRHIIMKPIPDKRLGFINAEYNSAAGLIKSSWKYEGEKWIWNFTIPEGATASVTLPGETEPTEYGAGTYTVSK